MNLFKRFQDEFLLTVELLFRNCKVASGMTNDCTSRLKASGLGKNFWLGYKSDLDNQISQTQAADISQIDLGSYGSLYKMEGTKFAHDFTWEEKVASGGNISYDHIFNWKLTPDSTADDVTIQKINLADDAYVVVETPNQEFFILGSGQGLTSSASAGGSGGKESGGDTAVSGTLTSNEKIVPLRFALGGGYQATLDYLNSRSA
jgi:hypothetical protein